MARASGSGTYSALRWGQVDHSTTAPEIPRFLPYVLRWQGVLLTIAVIVAVLREASVLQFVVYMALMTFLSVVVPVLWYLQEYPNQIKL